MTTMYDSIDLAAVPDDAELVGAYVDGHWPTYAAAVERFGAERVVSITVTGVNDVMVCDCETGDLTPESAARWAHAEIAAGRRPTIYCSKDTLGQVADVMTAMEPAITWPLDWWVADWTGEEHRVGVAVATQYANPSTSGGNFDLSFVVDGWPRASAPAPTATGTTPAPTSPPTAPPQGGDVQVPEIKAGATGGPVKAVQGILNAKAGARLAVDGDFGAKTETAVRAWQEFFRLAVDGVVGPATWSTLVDG